MVLCGVCLAGFSTSVFFDVLTRTLGCAVALAAGGHQHVLRLRHLHRRRRGDATQRPPLSLGDHREHTRRAPPRDRDLQPTGRARGRAVHGLFRLHQFPAGLWQLPHAVDDADRLALCGDPGSPAVLIALFTVEQLVNGWRHGFEIATSRLTKRCMSLKSAADEQRLDPDHDGRAVPRARLYRRAGRVQPDRRGARSDAADADQPAVDHRAAVQRHRCRSAAGRAVLPAGRRVDDLRQCGGADDQPLASDDRPSARRPCPGRDLVQHVLLGDFRLVLGRRRGAVAHPGAVDGARGLRSRLHRSVDRLRLDNGEFDPAEHHGGGLRRDRQRFDRRALSRRRRAGRSGRPRADDLQLFLRPGRRS